MTMTTPTMRLLAFDGEDGEAECTACESPFRFSAGYDHPDPSVGWAGGWYLENVALGYADGRTPHEIAYRCAGRRLLEEHEALAVAQAGGLAPVADCDAVLTEDALIDDLEDDRCERIAAALIDDAEARYDAWRANGGTWR
jgi:hypothetical protein